MTLHLSHGMTKKQNLKRRQNQSAAPDSNIVATCILTKSDEQHAVAKKRKLGTSLQEHTQQTKHTVWPT